MKLLQKTRERLARLLGRFVSFFRFDGNKYAYKDIKEFEDIVGYKVYDTGFRMGWQMARTKMKQLRRL